MTQHNNSEKLGIPEKLGISGRIARHFQEAQITPLLALLAMLLGLFAVLVMPREEEPQIDVTMANVLIPFPGALVKDVEQMVAVPAEQVLAQMAGVEHVSSASTAGMAVITVQFKVGVPRTPALVELYNTIHANQDWLPKNLGVGEPVVKPKGIDDVPILTATMYAKNSQQGAYDLERIAHTLEAEIKHVPGTREVVTLGGPGRVINVLLDPARMAASNVTVAGLRNVLHSANAGAPLGDTVQSNRAIALEAGRYLASAQDVADLVVGIHAGQPVFLRDVASVQVGGPTILATFTVIAALLPMAFVSGLMGPYMSPIPINASMGMLISLAVAFSVTPWLCHRWLKAKHHESALAGHISRTFQRLFT